MAKKKITSIWNTQAGDEVRVCDMTDMHLVNTIKYLEKRAASKYENDLDRSDADDLSDIYGGTWIMNSMDQMLTITLKKDFYMNDIYYDMVKEADNRKLDYGQNDI